MLKRFLAIPLGFFLWCIIIIEIPIYLILWVITGKGVFGETPPIVGCFLMDGYDGICNYFESVKNVFKNNK